MEAENSQHSGQKKKKMPKKSDYTEPLKGQAYIDFLSEFYALAWNFWALTFKQTQRPTVRAHFKVWPKCVKLLSERYQLKHYEVH